MAICEYAEGCPFFKTEIGYSPEMYQTMKRRFCLEDNTGCVRLAAIDVIGLDNIPDELLPTDSDRLLEIASKLGIKP